MKKRLLSIMLAFCLMMALMPSAAMAVARDVSAAEEQAEALKSLGLFKGVSDTNFDLERAPSRVEALVILIRNLGKESEALSGSWSHPFTDVPSWADQYVGYAYENALTNGVSATAFGTTDANAAMFLTFTLRALGYTDTNGEDFTYSNPYTLATQTGILYDGVNQTSFWRADAVLVSAAALGARLKDSTDTLAEKLITENVFTDADYAAVSSVLKAEKGTIENPPVTDASLTAPVDIHLGTRDRTEWSGSESVTVATPCLLWTNTNTDADCFVVCMYDQNNRNVFETTYHMGDENKNCYYDLTWLLDSCLEDYAITTITLSPLKSDNGTTTSGVNGYEDPVGVTAVFECFCPVTSRSGAAIKVMDVSTAEWSDDYKYLTFAGTYEPLSSVTLYCNYVVDESWGESGGRWGIGGTVDGEGKLTMSIENEKYEQLLKDKAEPEISIVTDVVVENNFTASGNITIYPVTIQP